MRALFLATANPSAARVLWRWLEAGHEVAGFWHPDADDWRPDRRYALVNPAWSVGAALRRHGIAARAVAAPARTGAELGQSAAGLDADTLICCHFPYRIPATLVDLYDTRAVNFHPSLLPAFRGPIPTMAMLLAGAADRHGGVSLHRLGAELDAGDLIAATPVPCPAAATLLEWRLALARAAGDQAAGPLPAYLEGRLPARPQAGEASYVNALAPEWTLIDHTWSAQRVEATLARLGDWNPLQADGPHDRVRVKHLLRRLGPPTGQPPLRERGRLTLDLADARVVLSTREHRPALRRLRELWTVARARG